MKPWGERYSLEECPYREHSQITTHLIGDQEYKLWPEEYQEWCSLCGLDCWVAAVDMLDPETCPRMDKTELLCTNPHCRGECLENLWWDNLNEYFQCVECGRITEPEKMPIYTGPTLPDVIRREVPA